MNRDVWVMPSRGRSRKRLQASLPIAAAAATAILAWQFSDSRARAAAPTNPDSAIQRLSDEFDLVPKLLSPERGRQQEDPLGTISRRMTVIHGDLSQFETDNPVQTRERQVVQSLDELIAALERHCNGLGRGHQPGSGRKASIIVKGDPSFGDLHGVNPNARQWAQLPPKLRSQILQSKTDGFPPGYEALLQSYYQQLAEEKTVDEKSPDSPPADMPAPPARTSKSNSP